MEVKKDLPTAAASTDLTAMRARMHELYRRRNQVQQGLNAQTRPYENHKSSRVVATVQHFTKVIETIENQFNVNSPSACLLSSAEAAVLLLQRGHNLAVGMIDSIVRVGNEYKSDAHLEVEDVLEHVHRYKTAFQVVENTQITLREKKECLERMQVASESSKKAVACILVRPPEAICIAAVPMVNALKWILFDSHKRSEHEGAAFLEFEGKEQLAAYLDVLFPALDLGEGFEGAELLATLGITIVNLREINGTLPKLNCLPLENVVLKHEVTTLKREVTTLKREKVALKAELARSKIELEQWQDLAKASIEAQEAGYQASSSSPSGNRENSSRAGRIPSVCNKSFDRGSSKPQQHESDNYKAMNKSKELQEDPEEASLRLIEQMLAEEAEEMVVMQEHQKRLQKEEEELKKRSEDDRKLAMELQNQWRSFECSICMEDKSLDDVFYTDQCDHPFCRKWILHLEFPIPCPGCTYAKEKEPAMIGQDLVQIVVDVKDYQNYLDKTLQKHAQKEGLFTCPQANCKGLAELVSPNKQFWCQACHFSFCTACLIPWHSGVTCEAYQAWKKDNDNADELTNAKLRELKVLPCPACRQGVEKSEGCNKMTCRCGTLFCFRCAVRLDSKDPYRHFNETACKLFDDNEL